MSNLHLRLRYSRSVDRGQDRAEYVVGLICAVVVVAVALAGNSLLAHIDTLMTAIGAWLGIGTV